MARFRVWLLDVWGDAEEHNVNDRRDLGTIEVPEGTADQDLLMLLPNGLGRDKVANVDVHVDESDYHAIEISFCRDGTGKESFFDGCPWLTLERQES